MSETGQTDVYVINGATGLTRRDLAHLESVFPRNKYTPNKHTIEDIMFIEGTQAVLEYIRNKLVSKRDELTVR